MAERFTISGRLGASMPPWIGRHAARIGIEARIRSESTRRIELWVDGPPALLDAMEMGCLLGPIDIWIDSIRREPLETFTRIPVIGQSA